MTILEWLIIGGIAATILSIIFSLYSLLQVIVQSGKLKKLPKKPPKAPKKRKRWLRTTDKLKMKRKKAVLFFSSFFWSVVVWAQAQPMQIFTNPLTFWPMMKMRLFVRTFYCEIFNQS